MTACANAARLPVSARNIVLKIYVYLGLVAARRLHAQTARDGRNSRSAAATWIPERGRAGKQLAQKAAARIPAAMRLCEAGSMST